MPETIEINELAKRNPKIDLKQLEESQKLNEDLQRLGIDRSEIRHRADSPRRRARIMDDINSDPRVVRLQRQEK